MADPQEQRPCPLDAYGTFVRARALGVPPWEMLTQPLIWGEWAQIIHLAESKAARLEAEKAAW